MNRNVTVLKKLLDAAFLCQNHAVQHNLTTRFRIAFCIVMIQFNPNVLTAVLESMMFQIWKHCFRKLNTAEISKIRKGQAPGKTALCKNPHIKLCVMSNKNRVFKIRFYAFVHFIKSRCPIYILRPYTMNRNIPPMKLAMLFLWFYQYLMVYKRILIVCKMICCLEIL